MTQYKIREGGYKEIRKKMLLMRIPVLLFSVIVGLAIQSRGAIDKESLMFTLPLLVLSLGFGLYLGLRRQKGLFDSYRLSIADKTVTREQINTPVVSIHFFDIKEIVKKKNGDFSVRGEDRTDVIIIPAQIENYEALEKELSAIQPFADKSSKPFYEKYRVALMVISAALMYGVYAVENDVVVGVSGILLIGLLLWGFYEALINKNVDDRTRRYKWLIFIVIASIIGVMIKKLTGVSISDIQW